MVRMVNNTTDISVFKILYKCYRFKAEVPWTWG